MLASAKLSFDPAAFSTKFGGVNTCKYDKDRVLYAQGDAANALLYIQKGNVKLTVLSEQGKERVAAIIEAGNFCGEGCLAGQPLRVSTATTMTECTVVRLDKAAAIRALHEDLHFAEVFVSHLLARNAQLKDDLNDHLFNSSEQRLARALLTLAHYEQGMRQDVILPHINQLTLAKMIGTTRSRVNFFMNKFRRLGFIDYNGQIRIHNSLLNVVLHDPSKNDVA